MTPDPMAEQRKQSTINNLMAEYGRDFADWPWKHKALPGGLRLEDLTDERLRIAEQASELIAQKEEKGISVMKIKESAARKMLVDVGLPLVETLNVMGLRQKIEELPQIVCVLRIPESKESRLLQKQVLDAIQDGRQIIVESEFASKNGGLPDVLKPNGKAPESTKQGRQAPISRKVRPDPPEEEKVPRRTEKKAKKRLPNKRKGMSALEAAHKVLTESKKPLKPDELIERMASKGYWKSPGGKTPQDTLRVRLTDEINKKGEESRFRKEGKAFTLA